MKCDKCASISQANGMCRMLHRPVQTSYCRYYLRPTYMRNQSKCDPQVLTSFRAIQVRVKPCIQYTRWLAPGG